jgi:hypothetical protein
MSTADATLAVFTIFNSLRFLAYVPQISKAIKDRSGAEAISFGTWALFLASHASGMAYAIENQGDWKMASLFLSNIIGCSVILAIAGWKRSRHRRLCSLAGREASWRQPLCAPPLERPCRHVDATFRRIKSCSIAAWRNKS